MYKILSYLLMFAGVLIILFALHGMYQAFAGGQPVPDLVHFADLQLTTQAGPLTIPMAAANMLANMSLFSLFMFFVTSVGMKIASLGCQLLKNERICEALLLLNKTPSDEVLKKL